MVTLLSTLMEGVAIKGVGQDREDLPWWDWGWIFGFSGVLSILLGKGLTVLSPSFPEEGGTMGVVGGMFGVDLLEASSSIGEELLFFHNSLAMGVIVGIMAVVVVVMLSLFLVGEESETFKVHSGVEFTWILLPLGILLYLGQPSVSLLYAVEEGVEVSNSLSITGYQWYWTYGMSEEGDLIESYGESNPLGSDGLSNFEASSEVSSDHTAPLRLIVAASDVMHSWALPSLFLKVDAIPGRLNQAFITPFEEVKTLYGQCSELCGVNHSFMPIVVCFIPKD